MNLPPGPLLQGLRQYSLLQGLRPRLYGDFTPESHKPRRYGRLSDGLSGENQIYIQGLHSFCYARFISAILHPIPFDLGS